MTDAFRRASHHSINKKVSKMLKFMIAIVLSNTEIVISMQIAQSAARIIGETVSN